MKVNTDGVLLALLAEPALTEMVLEIGTGTGVMSLILAQRFPVADIQAVEIEKMAADTAAANFLNSSFNTRLRAIHTSFEEYFEKNQELRFDLIISNPPFFIDSLTSDKPSKRLARHTGLLFFEELFRSSARHLNEGGELVLIVPLRISMDLQDLAGQHELFVHKRISIHSFKDSIPHREILSFGFLAQKADEKNFVIYESQKQYSYEYRELLKEYFTIF
jgi:tRNA1Val (adenine37-N6)-methyltransferase